MKKKIKRGEEERKEEEKRSWQRGIKTRKQIEEQIKDGEQKRENAEVRANTKALAVLMLGSEGVIRD